MFLKMNCTGGVSGRDVRHRGSGSPVRNRLAPAASAAANQAEREVRGARHDASASEMRMKSVRTKFQRLNSTRNKNFQ